MTIQEIEQEFGPVQIVQSIFKAVDDPVNIKQNLKVLKPGSTEVVDIKYATDFTLTAEKTGWEKLKQMGIHQEHIERIQ